MNRLHTFFCVLTCAILGSSFTVSRSVADYPILTGQALRYTLAALALGALAARLGWLRPTRSELVRLAGVAATGLVAFNVLLLFALRHADPSAIGTIVGASPLLLALLGPLQERRRPDTRMVLAAMVVVLGAGLVAGGGRIDGPGLAAAVGVLVCEAAFSLLAAPLLPRLGPVRVSAWSTALAVPMLLVLLPFTAERPRLPTVPEAAALAFLGLVLTVIAFICWYAGVAALGIERAGVFVGLVPVFALATVTLTDRVTPDPWQVGGVLAVAAGLVLGQVGPRRANEDGCSAPLSSSAPAASPASRGSSASSPASSTAAPTSPART